MEKKSESIWEKDITPGVVAFMTMDITPDFSSPFWTKDITHHVIGTLAVFGLVVSSLVATLGVATVGVNVELAFARQTAVAQTASLVLADDTHPASGMMPMANGSTTPPRPPKMDERMASGTPLFCPKLSRTIGRGRHEATTTGDVGQLQQFIANHYNLDPKEMVTGHFGSTTEGYLKKFQEEQGIVPASSVGPLTRAAIARLCNPSGKDPAITNGDTKRYKGGNVGSPLMGSSTVPMPHREDGTKSGTTTERHELPVPPKAPTPPAVPNPVSYNNDTSNAASIIEAMAQIGDGYGRLLTASLKMFGL